MKPIPVAILGAAAILLAACGPQTAPLLIPTPGAGTSPPPETTSTAALIPVATAAPQADPPRYHMEMILDYAARSLAVGQTITYTNRTTAPLGDLVLVVDPAHAPGVFELARVSGSAGLSVRSWELADGVLRIVPASPIPPGEAVALSLGYTLKLPEAPGKLGYFNRQLNLGDWYPFFPIHDPEAGWLAHPPHKVGETLAAELAGFEIRLEIENAPQDLQIAASAPGTVQDGVYLFEGEAYRNFSFSLSDNYEIGRRMVGDVEVASYYFPEHAGAGQAALDAAADALEVFAGLFGPYPHKTYSIVAGNFPDGLEFDGLTFVSQDYYFWYDGTLQNYLILLIVHEAAHQWFYMLVGNDQALEPWLDETLALYSELLYIEARYPSLAGWWWTFRIDPYRPLRGSVDDPVYAHDQFRPYVNAVYLRGADLMQALRAAMGDEAFFAALRAYVNANRGRFIHAVDLMGSMDAATTVDLEPIWDSYLNP